MCVVARLCRRNGPRPLYVISDNMLLVSRKTVDADRIIFAFVKDILYVMLALETV